MADEMEVVDNRERSRFEMKLSDDDVAIADYRLDGDRIFFTHTEVPYALRGRGLGEKLVRAALASARARGLEIVPVCPFVREVMGNAK